MFAFKHCSWIQIFAIIIKKNKLKEEMEVIPEDGLDKWFRKTKLKENEEGKGFLVRNP